MGLQPSNPTEQENLMRETGVDVGKYFLPVCFKTKSRSVASDSFTTTNEMYGRWISDPTARN